MDPRAGRLPIHPGSGDVSQGPSALRFHVSVRQASAQSSSHHTVVVRVRHGRPIPPGPLILWAASENSETGAASENSEIGT